MEGDERVQQIERDIRCFPVAQELLARGVVVQRLTSDELGNEIPSPPTEVWSAQKTLTTLG